MYIKKCQIETPGLTYMVTFQIHCLPAISLAKIRTCNQKHKKPLHLTRIFTSKELFNKIGNLRSKIEYASSPPEGSQQKLSMVMNPIRVTRREKPGNFRSTSRINNQFHMASKEGSLDQSPGSRNYFYLCCFYMCFQTVHSQLCCRYMSMHLGREPYSKTLWKLSFHKSIVLVARTCVQRKDLIVLITCKCAPKLEPCLSLICFEHMIWLLWLNTSHKHLKISIQ